MGTVKISIVISNNSHPHKLQRCWQLLHIPGSLSATASGNNTSSLRRPWGHQHPKMAASIPRNTSSILRAAASSPKEASGNPSCSPRDRSQRCKAPDSIPQAATSIPSLLSCCPRDHMCLRQLHKQAVKVMSGAHCGPCQFQHSLKA